MDMQDRRGAKGIQGIMATRSDPFANGFPQ